MAADLAISLATPFLEYLITPIGRQCGYILFYKRYLRELEEGVDNLKVELEMVQREREAAERDAKDINEKYKQWIDKVHDAVKEADEVLLEANTVILLDKFQSCFKTCIRPPGSPSQPAEQGAADTVSQGNDLRRVRQPNCCLRPMICYKKDVTPHGDDDRARSFYLNPVICYKKGRKAKKTMLVVQELNEAKNTLGGISDVDTLLVPLLSAKDYESFGSRKAIVKDIIEALSNATVSTVGVWGMGGIGKSTLMKQVMKLAQEQKLFGDVAMAVVSQNPDVKKIQGELAVWLGLNFKDDEHVSTRAARLHKRLKSTTDKKKNIAEPLENKKQDAVRLEENQDAVVPEEIQQYGWGIPFFQWNKSDNNKSSAAPVVVHSDKEQDQVHVEPVVELKPDMKQKQVLIILDDIWRGLDLEEIGIPLDHAGAVKLVFTSRKQHVLFEMGCSKNVFQLEVLKDEEPWKLFESIVGEIVISHGSRFRSIGEQVVEKCSGLPVVLKAIATTLKNCSLPEWEDALVQFKGSKDAYSNLEISYKHLESEELKSLFLVCALTNRVSIPVQDLLYYSMGLGLLKGTNTVTSSRHKLKALLHSLQDSSLLLKDGIQDPVYAHIHDVVREVAIRILARDQDSLLITDEFELKVVTRKKLKNSKAISIPYANIQRLPEGWECPELKMFLLHSRVDDPLIGISDSFFEGMKELSVLDISGRRCDSLPSSIQFLLNLTTLCLDYCLIEDLTIIGKLKQLQILTFRGSKIARLPKEIGELSKLKVLNLENSKLEIIEPQVLGKLTSLEELRLKGSSFILWEDEGEMQPSNAKVSELNNLSNLSVVTIHIHNPRTIPKHLEFGNLAEYIIQIGDVWDWAGEYKESRMLKIKLELCRGSFLHEKWVQHLLKRTQNLHLDGIKGWQRSIHELCLDGFHELKHLHLQNSPLVHCVARSSISNWLPYTAFTVLESLFLEKLTGLEMISRGPIAAESFSKLKVIKVIDCGKLKSLFSYSMLKCLSRLEEIEVRDCEAMQVIVTVDSAVTNTNQVVKLEALHRIELHNLPNVMTFCSSQKVEADQIEIKPTSSETVQEDSCIPTNTMFPNDQLVSFPLLKSLILTSLPKMKYIWQENSSVEVAKLETLQVSSCHDLMIVIPSSLVKEVKKLETLMVSDCGSVQEVFETSDGVTTSNDVEILSRLNNLELSNLPFLRHIWGNSHHQTEKVSVFQNLNSLTVVNCSSLMNLLPGTLLKSLNQLRKIYIKKCKEMEAFVPPVNDNIVFQSLVDVWLEDLPNMVTFAWTKGVESINFPSLKELYVKECPKMTAFCLPKEDASAPADQLCFFNDKVLLPVLARLDLVSMKSIQKIWHEEILEQSFCQLEILVVEECQALVDVLPSIKMTVPFDNLKEIKIRACNSLEGPVFKFAVEETKKRKVYSHYSLPQLEILWLFQLPKLKHVVQPDSHVVVGFPSLVDIIVVDCECIIDLFPSTTAATLSKLEDLKVVRCRSMTQIFGKDEEEDEMLDSIIFPCLRSILVEDLGSMISLFSGISCMLGFSSLEALAISCCSKLKTFVQSDHTSDQTLEPSSSPFTKERVHYLFDDKVELPNLKKVELYQLSTLQTVWKTNLRCLSIFDRIGQITEISIEDCENLEEFIFESDNGENEIKTTNDRAVFHSLANVTLENLPNMVAFIRGRRDQSINFPSLKELRVRSCQNMRAFYLPNAEQSGGGGGDGESLPLCFFDDKELLPKLVILEFASIGRMEKIWHEEIPQQHYCQIEQLLIKDCQNLVNIFPSNNNMDGVGGFQFQNLTVLIANGCPSLEGSLFDFAGEEKGSKGCKMSLPQLEKLWLLDLPKLEHVVEPTSHVVCSFPNLVDVQMGDNPCVIDLFPISTAPSLSKLQKMVVVRCGSMIQVFGKDKGDEEMMDPIFFPYLRSIVVQELDNLISFFSVTSSVIHFPSLEELNFGWCPKLTTFVQRYTIAEFEKSPTLVNEGVHYLFDDKVLLPKLLLLEFTSVGSMEKIWREEIPQQYFCQIEQLRIKDCQSLVNIFPSNNMMGGGVGGFQFQNLKVLIANGCPSHEGSLLGFAGEEKGLKGCKMSLPQLEKLWLDNLPKLEHVVEPTSHVICSFPNLVDVQMGDNPCVIDLFPISTAPSLTKLRRLVIARCGSMIHVFGEDKVEEKDEEMMMHPPILLFPCLSSLAVQNLDNLISFFSMTSSVIHFPTLEALDVSWCPKLKTFVQRCTIDEVEESSASVNEGVHYLFDDKVEFPNLKKVELDDLSTLQRVWKTKLPCLNICDRIGKITEITVVNCENLEEFIFESDDGEKEIKTTDDPAVFHSLAKMTLGNLPNMVAFIRARRDQSINFPYLKELYVESCQKMRAFYLPNKEESGGGGGEPLPLCFFDDKVEFPNLEKMKLFQLSSLQMIWKNEVRAQVTSLVKLTQLDIYDCGMIETIVSADGSKTAEDDGELVITFRELKHIGLHRLPSLTSFSSANCKFELPSLEEVIVIECPNLMVFSSSSVVTPKLSKVLLTEEEEMGKVHWDGDLNTTIQYLPK